MDIIDIDGDTVTVEAGDFLAYVAGEEDEHDVGEVHAIGAGELDVEWTGHRETVAPDALRRRVLVFTDRAAAFAAAGLTP